MLILATLSGIQDFLFDVQETGGGQARSLRARSLWIQLLADAVALRLLRAAGLGQERIVYSAAAKVAIDAHGLDEAAVRQLATEAARLERELLHETHGRLRLAVAIEPAADDDQAALLDRAHARLACAKLQTYKSLASGGAWGDDTLIVPDVWNQAREAERDKTLGRKLASARWLSIHQPNGTGGLRLLGWELRTSDKPPDRTDGLISVSNLTDPDQPPPGPAASCFRARRLMRHIPRERDGEPVEFRDLAERARGAKYLAVMKADADALGRVVRQIAERDRKGALEALRSFSGRLEQFFGQRLEQEQRRHDGPWRWIYTVFSGGDDMLVVGPWNIVLDFAGHVRALFDRTFGQTAPQRPAPSPLTLSAGIAVIKPMYPIHLASQQVEALLEAAKNRPAPGAADGRDQCAALGGIWKWADHAAVLEHGRRLAGWVEQGIVQRGWLHTLLKLSLLRRGEAGPEYESVTPEVATSRLAWHVGRNWKRVDQPKTAREHAQNEARAWADALIEHFDKKVSEAPVQVRYLPVIVRYAMLATGTQTGDNE